MDDRLSTSMYQRVVYDKDYTPNCTEIFVVRMVMYTNRITYALKYLIGKPISGGFYEHQLRRADQGFKDLKMSCQIRVTTERFVLSGKATPLNLTVG